MVELIWLCGGVLVACAVLFRRRDDDQGELEYAGGCVEIGDYTLDDWLKIQAVVVRTQELHGETPEIEALKRHMTNIALASGRPRPKASKSLPAADWVELDQGHWRKELALPSEGEDPPRGHHAEAQPRNAFGMFSKS